MPPSTPQKNPRNAPKTTPRTPQKNPKITPRTPHGIPQNCSKSSLKRPQNHPQMTPKPPQEQCEGFWGVLRDFAVFRHFPVPHPVFWGGFRGSFSHFRGCFGVSHPALDFGEFFLSFGVCGSVFGVQDSGFPPAGPVQDPRPRRIWAKHRDLSLPVPKFKVRGFGVRDGLWVDFGGRFGVWGGFGNSGFGFGGPRMDLGLCGSFKSRFGVSGGDLGFQAPIRGCVWGFGGMLMMGSGFFWDRSRTSSVSAKSR